MATSFAILSSPPDSFSALQQHVMGSRGMTTEPDIPSADAVLECFESLGAASLLFFC